MTDRHPPNPPRAAGRPAEHGDLIAAQHAGIPTGELIARANQHLEAVYHDHPHLRAVPDPDPPEGSDAWYGIEPDPLADHHAHYEAALAKRETAQAAESEAPTVWAELCRTSGEVTDLADQVQTLWREFGVLLHHVAALEHTAHEHTTQLRDHAARFARRRRPRDGAR